MGLRGVGRGCRKDGVLCSDVLLSNSAPAFSPLPGAKRLLKAGRTFCRETFAAWQVWDLDVSAQFPDVLESAWDQGR